MTDKVQLELSSYAMNGVTLWHRQSTCLPAIAPVCSYSAS